MTVEQAKDIIEGIVSGDEYVKKRVEIPSWIQNVLKWFKDTLLDIIDWFADLIGKIFGNLSGIGSGTGASVIKVIAFVVLAALAGGLLFIIIVVVLKLLRSAEKKKKAKNEDTEELVKLAESPDVARQLYEKNLAEGNYREAYRYLFILLLVELNKRELIQIKIFKTNSTYRREILAYQLFDEKVINEFFVKFNYVRFGNMNISEEEVLNMYGLFTGLVEFSDKVCADRSKRKGGENG